MVKRIIFDSILILALLFVPWWVVLVLGITATFYFTSYYEFIALGVVFDLLYSTIQGASFGYGMLGFIVSVTLFLLIARIKRELR